LDIEQELPGIDVKNISLNFPLHAKNIVDTQTEVGGNIIEDKRGKQWVAALRNVSLSIRPGERIGVTGHNGAGKSTLLQVLAGTQTPQLGQVEVRGRVSRLLSPSAGMQPYATGLENIKMRGMLQGMNASEIEAAIPNIDEFTELGPFLNVPIAQYSGGMRLRLSFAIATAMKPDILLIDEWMGAGDRNFQDKANTRFEAFSDNASILVLASHNSGLIEKFCNRTIRMEKGRIVEDTQL